MSMELIKDCGYKKGQKLLYLHMFGGSPQLEIVTLKDITTDSNDFVVVLVEEFEGYIETGDVYSREQINKAFDEGDRYV